MLAQSIWDQIKAKQGLPPGATAWNGAPGAAPAPPPPTSLAPAFTQAILAKQQAAGVSQAPPAPPSVALDPSGSGSGGSMAAYTAAPPPAPGTATPAFNPAWNTSFAPGQNLTPEMVAFLTSQRDSAYGQVGGAGGMKTMAKDTPLFGNYRVSPGSVDGNGFSFMDWDKATEGGPLDGWYEGQKRHIYDNQGKFLKSEEVDGGPEGFIESGGLALLALAAMGGGAALTGAGVIGGGTAAGTGAGTTAGAGTAATAGGAGYGIVGGATEPIASLALGGGTTAAATGGGILSTLGSTKEAIAASLAKLGMSGKEAVALGAALAGGISGGGAPTLGSGGGGAGGGMSNQSAEAKAFLEAVMPYVRYNSSNPAGSASWTRNPDGSFKLDTKLNAGNQGLYDGATAKLNQFASGIDPNAQAPALLDSVGGNYQQQLAQTIFDRTMATQGNTIDSERRAMQARLAEMGFIPGNEGYQREMNRWEDNLGEARNLASKDAQIQAASQALQEGTFTNASRTQGFKNSQDLQAQIAQLLAGVRNNATSGLSTLTSAGSAPTGGPANAGQLAQNKYEADLAAFQSKNQSQNDIIRALMQWGLA